MTGVLRCLVLPGLLLVLGGCMQRTVTTTGSRVTFADGWAAQTGDMDKIKEKFSSGFEIKDGLAVATDDRKNMNARNLNLRTLENKTFQVRGNAPESDKTFKTSVLNRLPEFKTSAARDERKTFATRTAPETGAEFATGPARETGSEFEDASRKARESKHNFFGGKRSARENSARTTAARPDLVLDKDTGRLEQDPTTLTEDQVRNILHPGKRGID